MVRRRGEIRRAALEEKRARVERATERAGKKLGGNLRRDREAVRIEGESGGEESRRQTGWQRRAHVARRNRIRQPSALITANGTMAN